MDSLIKSSSSLGDRLQKEISVRRETSPLAPFSQSDRAFVR